MAASLGVDCVLQVVARTITGPAVQVYDFVPNGFAAYNAFGPRRIPEVFQSEDVPLRESHFLGTAINSYCDFQLGAVRRKLIPATVANSPVVGVFVILRP